jgi:hypothetical protein
MKQLIIILTVISFGTAVSGQSKKKVKEYGIVSRTVEEYFLEDGMDEPVVETFEAFNEDGELIEIREYNRRGEVKKWEKYGYDEEGELVEETFLDPKGKVVRTEKTIYKDGLRAEKHFFNNRGKLYKKKVYVYEYR